MHQDSKNYALNTCTKFHSLKHLNAFFDKIE